MKSVIIISALLVSSVALAAGDGIPTKFILTQTFNFLGLIALLVYFLRNRIKDLFTGRSKSYFEHVEKAKEAKDEADKQHKDIKERLNKLSKDATQNAERAKAEAEELKHKIIADANTLAKRMEEEAGRSSRVEIEKAKNHLRELLIQKSIETAESKLKNEVDEPAQKKLQHEFVEKIQVVR